MRLFIIVAATWVTTVRATSTFDSTGNWSNEKETTAYGYTYEIKDDEVRGNPVSASETEHPYSTNVQHRLVERTQNMSASNEMSTEENRHVINKYVEGVEGVEGVDNKSDQENQTTSEYRQPVQIIQPYVINLKTSEDPENVPASESEELSRPARTSYKTSNDTFSIEFSNQMTKSSIDSSPAASKHERILNEGITDETSDFDFSSDEFTDLENPGGFGQRVRCTYPPKDRNRERSVRNKSKFDEVVGSTHDDTTADLKKYIRGKGFRLRGQFTSSYQLTNEPENIPERPRISLSPLEDQYRSISLTTKEIDQQKDSEYTLRDYIRQNEERSRIKEFEELEELEETATRGYVNQKHQTKSYEHSTPTETLNKTRGMNSARFSGPIVVPDFPGFRTLPFSSTKERPEINEATSTTRYTIPSESDVIHQGEKTILTKPVDENYLTSSSVVLNPLRVGLTLVNARELLNETTESSKHTNAYLTDDSVESIVSDSEKARINETANTDPYELEFQDDQLLQEEQTAKEVTEKSPVQSIEIQKSVELYHTAPVQEIHYPPEFVPRVRQENTGKSRLTEDSSRSQKPGQMSSMKEERRPSGQISFSVYKSNEILEENVVSPTMQRERNTRYEYNANENDVKTKIIPLASSSSSILYIPISAVNPSIVSTTEKTYDEKPVVLFADQTDDVSHTNLQYSSLSSQTRTKPNRPEVGKKDTNKQRNADHGNIIPPEFHRQEQYQSIRFNQPSENLSVINLDSSLAQNQEPPRLLLMKLPPSESVPTLDTKFLLPIPQPYPVEKIVEKTVRVPHMIEVEKLIEKKVPYPVEKVIEKQVTIPQPYPVQIQVPVDRVIEKQVRVPHIYPIHIERVIEKKVPYTVQRFIIQPYPVHIKVPQPVHVPVPIEKVVEKTVHVPRPYPLDISKFSKPVQQTYSLRYDTEYQHPIKTRESTHHQATSNYGNVNDEQTATNSSQFYGNSYNSYGTNRSPLRQSSLHQMSKKIGSYTGYHSYGGLTAGYFTLPGNSAIFRRQAAVSGIVEKDKMKDEYRNHVSRQNSGTHGVQTKSSQYPGADSQLLVSPASLRRARQESSFRQSKIEYGFKPPMVPSVQYDEKTASKVER